MSDKNIDSEDYDYDDGRYVTASDPDKKKKGSVWKGILFATIATVILELLVGQALDTRGNLVHRYIAYMLGIFVLFIVAYYSKSIWKMAFLGTPVVVAVSFIPPLVSPDNFSALMAPFVNIVSVVQDLVDDLEIIKAQQTGSEANNTQGIIDSANLIIQYGAIVDLVFAMIIGSLAGFGLVGFVKLFSNKPGIFTIFTFFFSLVFFVLGVIILPYLLVVTTGISQFGLTLAAGGLNLQQGFTVIDSGGDIADAQIFFERATEWFEQADDILTGIEAMKLFDILGQTLQDFKVLIDNLLILIDAAVNLVKGVSPMFLGISSLQSGMDKALGVLSLAGGALTLNQLSAADIQTFNEGLDEMSAGFVFIKDAIPDIEEALDTVSALDEEATKKAAEDQGADIGDQLDLIDGGINLFKGAIDVFEVLITPKDDTVEAPLIHLLRGILALSTAGDKVGATTSFDGTDELFSQVTGNFTLVIEIFDDPVRNQPFEDFKTIDVAGQQQLIDVRDQISGIFAFVKDAGNIAIDLGGFGIIATQALGKMNSTISLFEGAEFDQIPTSDYDAAILNFTQPTDGIIALAEGMMFSGVDIDLKVLNMSDTIATDDKAYGLMQNPASEFVVQFQEFGLGQNGANFFSLSKGFTSLLQTTRDLKDVDRVITNIQGNVTLIQALNLPADILGVQPLFNNINGSLDEADLILSASSNSIGFAVGNFTESIMATSQDGSVTITYDSLAKSMPQMNDTATAFTNIQVDIGDIQRELGVIQSLMVIDISNPLNTFPDQAALDEAVSQLNLSLGVIGGELDSINGELANVAIAS